jgi:hypothetical protein
VRGEPRDVERGRSTSAVRVVIRQSVADPPLEVLTREDVDALSQRYGASRRAVTSAATTCGTAPTYSMAPIAEVPVAPLTEPELGR